MWKLITPALFGAGVLALDATGAQAQTGSYTTYAAPSVGPYTAPYAAPGPVFLNRSFSYGYGAPAYTPYCPPEGTWLGPWSLRDPYSWYRPYSSNVGPKAGT